MRIALIDASFPINTRNQKYIDSLRKNYPDADIKVIAWKRDDIERSIPEYHDVYYSKAAYGNLVIKLLKLKGFYNFIVERLKQFQPDVIIASHWEALLMAPANLKSRPLIIYENLDVPTGPYPIRKLTEILEKRKLRKTNLIVHASRFFKELYPLDIPQIVLENKSQFNFEITENCIHEPLVFSYIGTVRYRDIFKNFLTACNCFNNIEVKVFGSGQDLNYLKEFAANMKNVSFYGAYNFSQIPSLYESSDVVWAAYPNKDFNVVYAISNKFHESLSCGKPCIYADNTKLGDYVRQHGIGYTVDPYSVDDIKKVISHIIDNKDELAEYKRTITKHKADENSWDDDFMQIVDFINSNVKYSTK